MVIELVWPETVGWTDAEAAESQSDSSLNCGNDSVMHSAAAATERERERREGGAQFCRLLRAEERLAGCVAPANLEPKLAYFTPR